MCRALAYIHNVDRLSCILISSISYFLDMQSTNLYSQLYWSVSQGHKNDYACFLLENEQTSAYRKRKIKRKRELYHCHE